MLKACFVGKGLSRGGMFLSKFTTIIMTTLVDVHAKLGYALWLDHLDDYGWFN